MDNSYSGRSVSFLLILAGIVSCVVGIYAVRRLVYAFGITYFNVEVGLLFDAIVLPVTVLIIASVLLSYFHKQKDSS